MILISSLTPLEAINTKEDITSQDWFLLQTNIRKKSPSDNNLQTVYNRLYLYSFWYKETSHLYLMTDNYYYNKTKMCNLLPHYHMLMINKKMPSNTINNNFDYIQQYKSLSEEERIITESDIDHAFKTLLDNNFKEHPIIHTILGERN